MTAAEWIGSAGVALLLAAFAANLLGALDRRSRPYQALNAVGAGLACGSAWLIGFMPFVILEGVWALTALTALAGRRPAGSSSSRGGAF